MAGISKEWTGALSGAIILLCLSLSDDYGYGIIQKVKKISEGEIKWKEASIYPVLAKLQKEGLIKSYWKVLDNERPRRYYTILDEGRRELGSKLHELQIVNKLFDQIIAERKSH